MRKRLSFIPQRRPIFVGCEGESESGYVGLLQDLIREANIPVHLLVADLGIGAGDPLTRIEMAARKLEQFRRTRTAFTQKFVLLDSDQVEADKVRAGKAQRLATQHGIQIVWQRPCFEAVLLRHLPACASRRPPDSLEAGRALLREWPEYKKPMSRGGLSRRITLTAILQAADVEPELKLLLKVVGLIGKPM